MTLKHVLAGALLALAPSLAAAQVQPGLPSANTVYAGPTSGPAAAPSFRTLAPADLGSALTSAAFDAAFCTTQNAMLVRGASVWACQTTLPSALMPGLTGDVASTAGTAATTIQPGVVTGTKIASGTVTGGNIAAGTLANSNLANMATNTVKCNPTTTTATPTDCSYPYINVKDYGATGNGSTDDTTAIQNAINALPNSGGVVLFPVGNYKVSSTVNVGNGTSSSGSTKQGIILQGIGDPNTQPIFPGFTATSGPKITWAGSGSGGIISINGPLQGWGVQNLYLDCANTTSSIGLNIISAQMGDSRNLTFVNCFRGIASTTYNPFGSFTNTDSFHNKFHGTSIQVANISGAMGILLTGAGTSDTDVNLFTDVNIFLPTTTITVFGIYLQLCDTNVFVDTHIYGGNPNGQSISFDYSVNTNFPSSNMFHTLDPFQASGGASFTSVGTPANGIHPNMIFPLAEGNSAVCPTTIPNFACYGGNTIVTNPGGNNNGTNILGAWTTFTPSPACGTATFTVNSARSKTIGKNTYIEVDITLNTLGTCANNFTFTLPNVVQSASSITGRNSNNGKAWACYLSTNATTATCGTADGSAIMASDRYIASGVYENQ
jgi:hypothetical protein